MDKRVKWGEILREGFGVEDVAVMTGDPVEEIRAYVRLMRANGLIKNIMRKVK